MTSPRGMRCLCVALDVLTLSCCYQRVREEPDAGRDQLQRSHQRLQRDRRDCSHQHQRQNPRAASAPSKQLRWMRALLESEARGDVHPRAEIVLR